MDLFTKRCGCGAIYRPAVRTQAVCERCGERRRAEARHQAATALAKEQAAVLQPIRDADFSQPYQRLVFSRPISTCLVVPRGYAGHIFIEPDGD